MSKINVTSLSYLHSHSRLDAEFFQRKYLLLDEKLHNAESIARIAETVDLQSNGAFKVIFDILNDSNLKEIPYVRSGNVGDFFINKEDLHLISKIAHSKLPKTHTKKGDVLMARKGKIGGATIITQDDVGYNSNDNVVNIRLRSKEYLPWYVVAFWNSKFGLQQVERYATGNVQPWLSMRQVRMLKTVKLPIQSQEKIAELVQRGYEKHKLSIDLYSQATQLLEEALGLNKIEFSKQKNYTASFNEVVSNFRADADYYQTKYRQLAAHIDGLKTTRLGAICNISKGIEVGSLAYTNAGPLFIRVSNITKEGITTGNSDKYISESTYNSLSTYKPTIGDILLTKDGTIGTCYVVDEEMKGIISGGILNLKILDTSIPKEYLALVINSKVCNMQANRDCSGALILHWKPEQIRKLRIPILPKDTMQELHTLCYKSKIARRQSIQLLADAKLQVETLIEKAAAEQ